MKQTFTKRKPSFSFKNIMAPMGWAILLSFLYNLFYIYGTIFLGSSLLLIVYTILLGMASAVGLYWICTKVWKVKFERTKEVLLPILVVEAALLIITLGVLSPLHSVVYALDQWYVSTPYQVLCALLIVLAQPLQLCMYSALTQNVTGAKEIKDYIKDKFLHSFKSIWNQYCMILLLVLFVDTLTRGIFSIGAGFDGYAILSSILVFGNPMFSWMFAFVMWASAGLNTTMLMNLFVLFLTGLFYLVVECNFLSKVGVTWINHGTKKTKPHKKKK